MTFYPFFSDAKKALKCYNLAEVIQLPKEYNLRTFFFSDAQINLTTKTGG